MKEKILDWLNKILVVDVFVVLVGFFWFAIALVGRSSGIPLGWDLWYSLWQPVFTPAIGLLMAGALTVALINQITKRFS